MKIIELTQGKQTIVDDEDYESVSQWSWHYNGGYAVRCPVKGHKRTFLHRFIMNTPDGKETDHINGDKLDNRKENLRICNVSQNAANRKVQNNNSGYKGVHYRRNKWEAHIKINGKLIDLGRHPTPEDAALAYNKKATEIFGEFAKLNEVS